jgi:hypothetical protein
MILIFSLVILILIFINFSLFSNKINLVFVYKIFIDIKRIRVFLVKIIVGILIFLVFNYNRYIYYGVGVTINYGYVFLYAFALVFLL